MKSFLLPLFLVLLCPLVQAQSPSTTLAPIVVTSPQAQPLSISEIFAKIPGLKQGVAYDIQGKQANYFTTIDILQWKGLSLAGGYSSDSKIVASVDYDLGGLSKFGINVPLLNLIDLRVGFYVGLGNMSTSNGEDRNKFAYGPEATIVSIKF